MDSDNELNDASESASGLDTPLASPTTVAILNSEPILLVFRSKYLSDCA